MQKYVSYSNQQKMALFLTVPVKSTTFDSKKNKKYVYKVFPKYQDIKRLPKHETLETEYLRLNSIFCLKF